MTPSEFGAWVLSPDNYEYTYELIAGKPIIKHPTNAYDSMIGARVLGFMGAYMLQNGDIGYITSANGGYCIGDERYVPDGAMMLYTRQKLPDKTAYNSVAPNLAIEVISEETPADELHHLIIKITNYHHAGCDVWVVDTQHNQIEVYEKDRPVKIYGMNDTLTIPALLPNFELHLKNIFVISSND